MRLENRGEYPFKAPVEVEEDQIPLDQLYVDKLDGKVSETSGWKNLHWQVEQERIKTPIQARQVADHKYYEGRRENSRTCLKGFYFRTAL